MSFLLVLLKSLDELLFETIGWLLFWPLTLFKTIRHPRRMLAYGSRELNEAEAKPYSDTLQPPLFLFLTVVLIHGIELATVGESTIVTSTVGLNALIDDDTNLLLLRLVSFGALPLILAARLIWRQGKTLDREVLRPHFYAQCYVAGALAFMMGIAGVGFQTIWPWAHVAGWILLIAAFGWYGFVQLDWFKRHLKGGTVRAFWDATVAMIGCLAVLAVVAALFG